jgi:hypothetical protein
VTILHKIGSLKCIIIYSSLAVIYKFEPLFLTFGRLASTLLHHNVLIKSSLQFLTTVSSKRLFDFIKISTLCLFWNNKVNCCPYQWPRSLGWRSLAEIAGSNRAGGMDVFVFWVVCCQVEVAATGQSLVQRSPSKCGVYNKVWSLSLDNEGPLAH